MPPSRHPVSWVCTNAESFTEARKPGYSALALPLPRRDASCANADWVIRTPVRSLIPLGNPPSIVRAMRRRHYHRTKPMGGRPKLIGSQPRRGAPQFPLRDATAASGDFIRGDLRRRQLGQFSLLLADLLEGATTVGARRWCLRFHDYLGFTGRGWPSFGTGFPFENGEAWRLSLRRNCSICLPRAAIRSHRSRTITTQSSPLNSSIGGLFAMQRSPLVSADGNSSTPFCSGWPRY